MKRKFTFLTAVFALLAFLAIPMGMRGQATTYTSNVTLPLSGTNVSSCKVNISGTEYDGTKLGKSGSGASANVTIPAGTTTLYVHCAAWKAKSSKLELSTTTSGVSITPSGDWTLTSDNGIANNSPFTLASPDKASTDYFREYTLSGVTSDIQIKFEAKNERAVFWGVNATSGTAPAVAIPTFSPAGGDYTTAQNVTISCETQGAAIYYTTDGSTPDNTSTPYTVAITVSSTTTIKAIAYVGTDASNVATATYNIMQPLTTMQAIFDKATEVGTTATSAFITLDNWVVSGVSTNGKNVFVTDGTKGFVIFDNGANMGFTAGDVLSGTVYCNVQLYNGFAELTQLNSTTSGLSIATGGTVTAANVAMADLAGVNTGALVHYENLTCSIENNKYYLSADTITLQVYNAIYAFGSAFVADHVYNITGVYQQYNTTKEVLPRSEEDIEEVATNNPLITAENVEIAYDATSGAIEYTIENEVTGGVLTAETESEWLTLGTVGATVPFTCTANDATTARTATVTLTYTYNRATVTKNVTVTQVAYEAPNVTWDLSIDQTATATTTEMTWTSNYATMAVEKGNSSTNTNNYYPGTTGHNYTSTRFYTGSVLTLAPVAGYAITSVVFNATTTGYASALTNSTWTNATATMEENGVVVTVTPSDGTADMVAVIGGTCGFTSVTVYYVEDNSPSIAANNVEIAYDATNGAITYTINNPVSGGVLTAATESEWLTLGTVGTTVPFTCTANTEASSRTATVTLTYTYNRATVTKNVTVTQAGNSNVVNNISDITAEGYYIVQGTIVAINNRGFILGDGTGYVYYYYGSNFESGDYDIGDEVKLAGSVVAYGGVFEFDNSTTITYDGVESNYEEEDPTVLTGADMDAQVASSSTAQLSSYVQYEGWLSVSDGHYNITSNGATTAIGRISYPLNVDEITALDGMYVMVTGYYVGVSSNTYYYTMLESIEDLHYEVILLDTYNIEVAAEGGEGSVNVTYQNFSGSYCDVYFYAADGTQTTYDWITAELDSVYNVHYIVQPNTGEARTAYFKVGDGYVEPLKSRDGGGIAPPAVNVYSDLVTVTQAAYVAPTFAELPFEYDGNGLGELPDGLTQNGLTGKYNNSPKMKFDDTGDWLLLQFNERPGTLTFDIMGNPGSGAWTGTFTLQTSEDGVTYTDFETYTELANTVQHESFSNLGANVRYIKWIFTEKDNGNVALGNIVLQPYVAPQEYTLTVSNLVDVNTYVFDAANQNNMLLEGEGSVQIYNGTQVLISVDVEDGYVLESLIVDGVDVTSQIDGTDAYTFTMPTHNVTVTATAIEYVAGNYVRISDLSQLTDGCKVIIAARYDEDHTNGYYAMPGQTSSKPVGVAFSSEISGTDEILPAAITTSEDTYYWTVNVTEDGYTFTNADGQMIGYSSGTNFATNNHTVWTITRETAEETAMVAEYTGFVIRNGNTNTRAFAFNGTAFGAYATSNMTAPGYNFFLDFFVQTEAPQTLTQTVALAAGTNWFSTYLEIELADLQNALAAATPSKSITIKSPSGNSVYVPRTHSWNTNAQFVWDVAKMYYIVMGEACEITLEGEPIDPAAHPITVLGDGSTNWIGFPFSESMSVTDAFAGFATNGDKIKSSSQNNTYSRGRWQSGNVLTTLEPGHGYLYISPEGAADRTLVYPAPSKVAKKGVPPFAK